MHSFRLSFRPAAAWRAWTRFVLLVAATATLAAAPAIDPAPRRFDVPAGDAGETLKRLAQQARREIVFPSGPVAGVTTNAVQGDYTVREALERLLADTGLRGVEDARTGALIVNRAEPAERGSGRTRQSGALGGRLTGADGRRPAAAVTVTLSPGGATTRTDALGRFEFSALAAGTYALAAGGEGVGRLRITGIELRSGASLTLAAQALPAVGGDERVVGAAQIEVIELGAFEVTVTVQKRPQSAQEVPISLTSLSGYTLERYKVESLRDLSRLAPNLLVSAFSQSSPTIAIRGATNTFSQIGVSKPVAIVIDDVFVPRNTAASFELFDLDSVQVLRGPQGTLFGRNVTGGAIVLNTRLPSFDTREAAGQVEFGNFNARKFSGYAAGPVAAGVAAKLTVSRTVHDGYGRDRLTDREQDDRDSTNLRGQIRVKLAPELRLLVSADYADDRNGGRTLSSKGLGADGDRRTSELGYPQSYARTMWGLAGRLDWATAAGDFSSITAYRESQSGEDYSGVGASYTFLAAGSQTVVRDLDHPGTFTQELRYASPKRTRGDFVAGVYLLSEDGYRNLRTRAFAARTGAVVTHQIADQKVETFSYAAYWDGTLHLSRTVDFTVGGRFTVDRKEAALVRTDLVAPANNFTARGLEKRWSEFTPRAVLAWSPHRRLKAYASVTKGFTAGGFNTEAATVAILTTPFAPETVTNYEAGVKGRFMGDRLRANLAAFTSDYADKQELYFNTATRILTIVNASKATMKGFEAELAATPIDGLTLTAAYGMLDTGYDSFVVPGVLNYTGNPLGSSPRYKYSLGADHEFDLGRRGFLSLHAAYTRTDGYYTGATKDPNLFVPAYSLVNASVGYATPDRRWRVTVWGKNLGDTDYLLTPSTQGVLAEYLGVPRTYGVTLAFRF